MSENKNKMFKWLMKKFKNNKIMQVIILIAFLLFGGMSLDNLDINIFNNSETKVETGTIENNATSNTISNGQNNSTIDSTIQSNNLDNLYYCQIDVGQGDSTLIQVNGKVVLIDAGTKASKEDIANHLEEHNIDKIDYLINTHSHADHIGGMEHIVDNFEIVEYMYADNGYTTKMYQRLMDAIEEENCKTTKITDETVITLGNDTYIEVLDDGEYNGGNLNNFSPIMYLKHGNTGLITSGDAEKEVEQRLLATEKNIPDVDVFKGAHHGSDTSNTPEFIKAINPELVVVSVGADNDYGHPHVNFQRTMQNLGINWIRTDLEGTIELKSDGNSYTRVK